MIEIGSSTSLQTTPSVQAPVQSENVKEVVQVPPPSEFVEKKGINKEKQTLHERIAEYKLRFKMSEKEAKQQVQITVLDEKDKWIRRIPQPTSFETLKLKLGNNFYRNYAAELDIAISRMSGYRAPIGFNVDTNF